MLITLGRGIQYQTKRLKHIAGVLHGQHISTQDPEDSNYLACQVGKTRF